MSKSAEWDNRYSSSQYIYGTEPNQFLKQELSTLALGKLLLPGEGEGRNALWAAKNGWEVTAIDFSQMAKQKAENLFANNGLTVTYLVNDIFTIEINDEFDAIALAFLHIPKEKKQQLANKMVKWLKPGGTLIMETFHPEQIKRNSGGPKNPDFFVSPNEIENYYKALNIQHIETKEICLNEGSHHKGNAIAIRMVAVKP
jgi:2-polyprenyl-3-methyl-5-hydroxy-6-metoxy-1,4-benzoquinol methylase